MYLCLVVQMCVCLSVLCACACVRDIAVQYLSLSGLTLFHKFIPKFLFNLIHIHK